MVALANSQGLLVAVIVCLVAVTLSRQIRRSLLSSPAPKPKSLTFRVDDIPIDHIDDFGRRLRSIAEQDPVLRGIAAAIVLRSLVPRDEAISCATVSIVTHLSGDSLCVRLRQAGKGHPYTYSCNFEGITPLYEAEGGADIDDEVWLRDFLPKEIPTIRVLLYGYDTVLPGSLSKQSIRDLGSTLLERITAFRAGDDTNRRPIVFVGHSLGGLLIKEALVQARGRRSDTKSDFSKATFGLLFFGVPNLGLRNEQLRTLVRGQPNESLINDLLVDNDSEPSSCLKSLANHFSETCRDYYRVVSFFERSLSPTIELGKDGKWRKTGRPSLLVTGDSATSAGLVAAADEDNIPLNTNHSGLVKFDNKSQGDYPIVRERIKKLSEEAKVEVARRFAKHDLHLQHSAQSEACMNSLAFQDIYGRQNNIETTAAGTCDWIFSHQSFLNWTEQKQGLLWIMGKPGSGKSTILKYALQKVPYLYGADTIGLSFFFHGRGNEMQRTQLGLFRSLLHQLLWQVPGALSDLVDEYRRKTKTEGRHGQEWDWDLLPLRGFLESALPRVLKRFSVIIFIDALDECGEESAVQLIQYLKYLLATLASTDYRLRICFSCRYYPVVNSKGGLNILLDKENQADIITYVQTKFYEDPDVNIEDLIARHAQGVFIWAQFVVERVLQLKRQGEPRGKIEAEVMKTPQDLEDFYHGLIEKVQDRTETLRLAQWICFSTRPLTTHELSWAMAYQPDCTYRSIDEWRNSENFITTENMDTRLKFLSCGLAEIVVSRHQRTVQFIHQSVKDYFIKRGLFSLDTKLKTASLVVPTANRLLAWSCTRYLNLAFSSSSSSPQGYFFVQRQRGLDGFLDYATISWVDHMKLGESVEQSPRKFLDLLEWPGGSLIHSWALLYRNLTSEHLSPESTIVHILSRYGLAKLLSCLILDADDSHFDLRDAETGMTPLSCAAKNEQEAVVKLLLETGKVNVNSTDKTNRSPLHWAVRSGNETIVKMLLDTNNVDVNLRDEDNWSPLSMAAETENFYIVKNLVETGKMDVNRRSSCGRTPLSWAASTGNEVIVRFLVDTGKADASLKDDAGRSPLSWAASSGNVDLFKTLLDAGNIAINEKDSCGRSPLSWAAGTGNEAIVKLLLYTGRVDINSEDVNSRTPFSWAAVNGHEAVIAILLGTGQVEVDTSDRHSGRTSLSLAAGNGHEAVVKTMLSTRNVDINSKDINGRTPCSWAAMNGHEAVVAILLGTGVVEIDSSDRQIGRTSLSWAAGNGYTAVIKTLLEKSEADVNSRDINGRSPLSWAAGNGHEDVVKLLVNTDKINVDSRDDSGQTPLWLVAVKENQSIMKFLLGTGSDTANPIDAQNRETPQPQEVLSKHDLNFKRFIETGKINVEHSDTPKGRTPLSWAAMNGHEDVVKVLLDAGKVEPDSKDNDGRSPLWLAARNEHIAVVDMLLQTGRVNINSQDNDGRTPLWWPAWNGFDDVVTTLVFSGKVDVHIRDNKGQTPLIWAAENGRRDMVKMILGLGASSINTKDNGGWTALSYAARKGHKEIVEDLLATGEVDIDPSNTRNDRMPLLWAAECGHESVVKILLDMGGFSVNSQDSNGWTALSCAARNGHVGVVEVLLDTSKVDVNSRDNSNQTPLWWAVGNGHTDVVWMLLNMVNADVSLRDNRARTPLLLATDIGNRDIVMMLLDRDKTHVGSQDDEGRTPLLSAAANGRKDLVKLLLSTEGADVNLRDNSGRSPLSWAAENGHNDIANILLARNVSISSRDGEQR